MAAKRRRRSITPEGVGTLDERIAHLEVVVDELTRSRVNVRREEHEQVLATIRKIEEHAPDLERNTHDLDIQFKRIAQLQADLDEFKRAWTRSATLSGPSSRQPSRRRTASAADSSRFRR